jgi:hypothetical protein
MEYAQNLDRLAHQTVGYDERGLRHHQFTGTRNSARSPHFRVIDQQCFDVLDDVKRDTLCCLWFVLFNVGANRDQIIERFRRPDEFMSV